MEAEPSDGVWDYERRVRIPGSVIAGVAKCLLGAALLEILAPNLPGMGWTPGEILALRGVFYGCVLVWLSLAVSRALDGNAWGCRLGKGQLEWHWPHWFHQKQRCVEVSTIRRFHIWTDWVNSGDGVALVDGFAIETKAGSQPIPTECIGDDVMLLSALLSANPALEVRLSQRGVRLWPPHRRRIEKLCQERHVKLTVE